MKNSVMKKQLEKADDLTVTHCLTNSGISPKQIHILVWPLIISHILLVNGAAQSLGILDALLHVVARPTLVKTDLVI